jgi:hypothetical protein
MNAEEKNQAGLAALEQYGSYRKASVALGIPRTTLRDWVSLSERQAAREGLVGGPPIPPIARPPEGFVVTHNSGTYDAVGNLQSQSVKTKAALTGEKYEIPAGHVVKGESAFVDAEGGLLGKWIKTREGSGEGLIEGLKEAFKDYKGKAPVVPLSLTSAAKINDRLLTLYPMPDLHLGMYAWGSETGANYDTKIAVKTALTGITDLVEQARPSKRAVILGLGDYFHANDGKAVTPGHGHLLDVDGRWAKVFAAGAKLATMMVDLVARKHEQVEVVFLPGNHDPDAAICLTVALSLFYANTPRIFVNDDPSIAWYLRFGTTLLGATHGHTMKQDRMPLMMAADRPKDWGNSKFRHFFSGHIHHDSAKEHGGVICESLTSPAARDAFNASSGYRSTRSLTAMTFHILRGRIGRHWVNI